jgi:hypothetical protein
MNAFEVLRWVVGLGLAGVVSYYTAIGSIRSQINVVEERENNHYIEVIRRLDRMETKLDRDRDDRGYQFGPRP